jgi:hypothetical protein
MSKDGQHKPDTKAEELQDEALDEAQGGSWSFGATQTGAPGVVSPRDPASGQATGIVSPRDPASGLPTGR